MANRRTIVNLSVKRNMQVKLFTNCMLISVAAITLMAAIFYIYSNREIGRSYRQFHIESGNFLDYLLPALLGAVALGMIASLLIAIFFPLRIAGPLYRIERSLEEHLGKGDLTARFNRRKGDEIADLAEALNETVDKLRGRVERIKTPVEELESFISQEKEPDHKELQQLVKKIGDGLREFKT